MELAAQDPSLSPAVRAAALRKARRQTLSNAVGRLRPFTAAIFSLFPQGKLGLVDMDSPVTRVLRVLEQKLPAIDPWSWQAIRQQQAVRWVYEPDAPASENTPVVDLLRSLGIASLVVAPLKSPLLDGYPGSLFVARRADEPAFSDHDLGTLRLAAEKLEALSPAQPTRVFVLDAQCAPAIGEADWALLDPVLQHAILAKVRNLQSRLAESENAVSDRLTHIDAVGRRTTVYLLAEHSHCALNGAAGVTLCIQPSITEWLRLSHADFTADTEIARLIPTLRYLHDHAVRNPVLADIAQSARLSPFHFHRRFHDLIGQTPKQFLLECQIAHAQQMLLGGQTELSKIAQKCGFSHQSHFTSRFKQATGFTPTRWRKVVLLQNND